MKKTKLLTSLAALALVVSLGACNEPTEDTTSGTEEPTSSETTTSEETSEGGTTSETTSEDGSTSETTSEDVTSSEDNTSGNTSSENPGTGDDEEAKKKAADLEAVQETLKGLGSDPFSGWEAYKYVLTEDGESETRLLATDANGNLIGYSSDDEMTTYYLDGVAYVDFDGEYFKEDVESYETVAGNLEEDGWFVSGVDMAIETITALTVDDVTSVSIIDNIYTVSYETFEDQYVLGTMTYKYTSTFVIESGALVSAKSESTQIHTAGSVGEGDYTKEVSESIEKVDPSTVSEDTLQAVGFDPSLWIEKFEDYDGMYSLIQETQTYSVTLVYNVYESVTYLYNNEDYSLEEPEGWDLDASDEDKFATYEELYLGEAGLKSSTIYNMNITEDYEIMASYVLGDDGYSLYSEYIYLNNPVEGEKGYYEMYKKSPDSSWFGSFHSFSNSSFTGWQDEHGSLNDNYYHYITSETFEATGETVTDDDGNEYDVYDMPTKVQGYLDDLGGSFIFGAMSYSKGGSMDITGNYLDKENQTFTSVFTEKSINDFLADLVWEDPSGTYDEDEWWYPAAYWEIDYDAEEITSTIYNVGKEDQEAREEVYGTFEWMDASKTFWL